MSDRTGLVADPLFASDLIAICHPDLATGSRPITSPQDLRHHVLLEDTHGHWPLFLEKALPDEQIPDIRTMNFSQTSLAIDAAIARQGVALTNREFVAADLEASRLCQPFSFSIQVTEGYYVVAPRTKKPNRRRGRERLAHGATRDDQDQFKSTLAQTEPSTHESTPRHVGLSSQGDTR